MNSFKERETARKLCASLTYSKNYQQLLPKVIQLMAHPDIGVKRISYSTYAKHCDKVPSEALLAVNTMLKDSCHQSPLVRALVLNTICYVRRGSTAGILHRVISDGLKDSSAFVRRHAVVAQYYASKVNDSDLQSSDLKVHVDDPDPIVSSLSLITSSSTEESSSEQTSLPVKLLNRLQSYTTDGVIEVVSSLKKCTPSSEELLDVLNILDPLLDSREVDVVTVTMDVFLLYSKNMQGELAGDMHSRILHCCLTLLRSAEPCTVYCILLWIKENLLESLTAHSGITPASGEKTTPINCKLILDNYHLMFGKDHDATHLSLVKLDILRLCISLDNISVVVEDFKSVLERKYRESVVCDRIITILLDTGKDDRYAITCRQSIIDIVNSPHLEVRVSSLKYLHRIGSYANDLFEHLHHSVIPDWKTLSVSDLLVLLNLSSKFAFKLADNVTHIHDVTKYVLSSSSQSPVEVKAMVLYCVTECFTHEPAEYISSLKHCVTHLERDDDLSLREQAKWCVGRVKQLLT